MCSTCDGSRVCIPALSQVLENTAFFGEIVLRLPNIAHAVLNMNKAGAVMLNWALGFSNSTGLYDETTTKLIHLVSFLPSVKFKFLAQWRASKVYRTACKDPAKPCISRRWIPELR